MKHRFQRHYFIIIYFLIILISGCTENPFGNKDQQISSRNIGGKVYLKDGAKPQGIFVWLETFDVGTRTDENGNFNLTLPSSMSEGGVTGGDGIFYLYFYVANYRLDSAQVVIVNGEVARSEGDINDNGELNEAKGLTKILNIGIDIYPSFIEFDSWGRMTAIITLRAIYDNVEVASRKRMENHVFKRSGLIFLDGEGNFVGTVGRGTGWRMGTEIISQSPKKWIVEMNVPPCDLPLGIYKVVPYLLVKQNNLPPQLIESMGTNVEALGPNYLNIPFVRQEGEFIIYQPSSQ